MSEPTRLAAPSLQILTPRRRGRPKAEQPSQVLNTRVPNHVYDRLCVMADARGVKLAALVRDLLLKRVP